MKKKDYGILGGGLKGEGGVMGGIWGHIKSAIMAALVLCAIVCIYNLVRLPNRRLASSAKLGETAAGRTESPPPLTGPELPGKSFLVVGRTSRKIMSQQRGINKIKADSVGGEELCEDYCDFRWNETDTDMLYYNRVPKTGSENLAFLLSEMSNLNDFTRERFGNPNKRRLAVTEQVQFAYAL